jgi:uncharacterized protein involved in outer membrane biogenesis
VLGDLLRAQGNESLSNGSLDLDIDVTGKGRSVREIMASLGGSLGVRMGPAVVNDKWVGIALSDVSSLFETASTRRGADVDCVMADFQIQQGVARPDALVVDLGSVALFGTGRVDLGSERIRLSFDRQSLETSASAALPPFEVKGTLAEPEPGVDAAAVAGHFLDLTASLFGRDKKEERSSVPPPSTCPELLASYRKAGHKQADSAADLADKAGILVGDKNRARAEKAYETLKGLFR